MNDTTTALLHAGPRPAHAPCCGRSTRVRVWGRIGALACILIVGCSDLHLSARELVISPDPAVPGDAVTATFLLSLIPVQGHTIILVIDDAEHLRVTSSDAPEIPVVLALGDAAELIATYGTGEHTAHVVVHVDDEVTRTRSVGFELNEPAPQE